MLGEKKIKSFSSLINDPLIRAIIGETFPELKMGFNIGTFILASSAFKEYFLHQALSNYK